MCFRQETTGLEVSGVMNLNLKIFGSDLHRVVCRRSGEVHRVSTLVCKTLCDGLELDFSQCCWRAC